MNNLRIYLSGSIQKGSGDSTRKSVWSVEDIKILHDVIGKTVSLSLLNPASRSDDLSDYESVFGRDLLQVYVSDLILVDARDRKGLGIGAEMMFAKNYGIPVISVAPRNSQYRKENLEYLGQLVADWTHPFVGGLSDYIAESVYDAAVYIKDNFPFEKGDIKNNNSLILMIKHYIDTQFKHDTEMYNMAAKDEVLMERIRSIF